MNEKPKKGQRIHFATWRRLMGEALRLSSQGYGVAMIGFSDMSENILTITELPRGENPS